ncbi:hypothetical protein [Streptomyces spongiicola]|uniref:hypothetical protein n=1 Tax=Streptomyces spongiicola TaxID=1690221 RepID=UPI0021D00976|nr:hypothetical protein [Streptomyces spongiicola]
MSSHPAKAIMAMPMVTSPKRPICSTKAMFSTRSVPIVRPRVHHDGHSHLGGQREEGVRPRRAEQLTVHAGKW